MFRPNAKLDTLPNPSHGGLYSIDLETKDPGLREWGSDAHPRSRGGYVFMAGIYHPATNVSVQAPWDADTRDWLRELYASGPTVIGANFKYDVNWCLADGVLCKPHITKRLRINDVLLRASMIYENHPPKTYSLDGQCEYYGLPMKPKAKLVEAALAMGIKCSEKTVMEHLWRLPWPVVAEYLDHDVRAAHAVWLAQKASIEELKVARIIELEERLLPVLALMEQKGARVDVEGAERLMVELGRRIEDISKKLQTVNGGTPVNTNTSNNLINFLRDARGHTLPHTSASKPDKPRYSTSEATLTTLAEADECVADIMLSRKMKRIAEKFCGKDILQFQVRGRIHPSYKQYISYHWAKGKTQGVKFGRLSCCDPNLQQVPKRDKFELEGFGGVGTAMRRLFIPEDGCRYMSADYAAQEPRWLAHYAMEWECPGAEKVVKAWNDDPTISPHDMVAEMVGIARFIAKIINLGLSYEMGRYKLEQELIKGGVDPSEAGGILDRYDRLFPHVSASSAEAKGAAEKLGYVRTHFGRRANFDLYAPVARGVYQALPYEQAYDKWVRGSRMPIAPYKTYRALNRIIQGSSADQAKAAQVNLWYDHGIIPSLQVHDQVDDNAIPIGDDSRIKIYKHVMENVVQLHVPHLAEIQVGPTWGDLEDWEVA